MPTKKSQASQTETATARDIADVVQDMADNLNDSFNSNGDLKVAGVALKAYNTTLKAHRDIMLYKKHMGVTIESSFYN